MTEDLFESWQAHVVGQGEWRASQYAGYYVKAVDITAYWRPTLKGLRSKHYDAEAVNSRTKVSHRVAATERQ